MSSHGRSRHTAETGFTFLGATFFPPARLVLVLANDFLGFGLAMVRFAAFPRADLEVLPALPRAADFPRTLSHRGIRMYARMQMRGDCPCGWRAVAVREQAGARRR
jgi:hypothetical protein